MKWLVTGADRRTGDDKSVSFEADDEAGARAMAVMSGVLVERITPMGKPARTVPLAYAVPVKKPSAFWGAMERIASPAIPTIQTQTVQPNGSIIIQMPTPAWSPGVAGVLSFLIPGAGQIYKGQPINGLVWLVLTVIGYFCLIIPGVVLHLCCIIGAVSGNAYKR